MVSIKNILLGGLFVVSIPTAHWQVADSTAIEVSEVLADDYYVAQDKWVKPNDIPNYDNPRKNSIIDLVKNQGVTRWYYEDANGKYVQFYKHVRKWWFVIKICDDMWFVIDKCLLDDQFQPQKWFFNNAYSKEEVLQVSRYCASVPLVKK